MKKVKCFHARQLSLSQLQKIRLVKREFSLPFFMGLACTLAGGYLAIIRIPNAYAAIPAPIISSINGVVGGTFGGPIQVMIACEPGTTTHITTDGTAPSKLSKVYCGYPILVNYSLTLQAVSMKNGVQSTVSSASYTLDPNIWPAPSSSDITPPSITPILPVKSP